MKSRFGKLGKYLIKSIHSRYGTLESIKVDSYYKIPKELIINSYYIEYYEGEYYLSYNNFNIRIWKSCEISIEDYYDIMILGIWNKSKKPRCPVCNRFVEFKSIVQGYRTFDTKSCNISFRNNLPEEKLRLSTHMSHLNKEWNSLPFSDKRCSRRVSIKSRRSEFINRGDPNDTCYLYLGKLDNGNYKYGVTSDINDRYWIQYMSGNPLFVSIKVLFESTRIDIANLEAHIKFKFEGNEYISESELSKLKLILNELLAKGPIADYID